MIGAAGGDERVVANQEAARGTWLDLGVHDFAVTDVTEIRLEDNTGEDFSQRRRVVLDAIPPTQYRLRYRAPGGLRWDRRTLARPPSTPARRRKRAWERRRRAAPAKAAAAVGRRGGCLLP